MEIKWLEHGQRHPYGDTHYKAEIHTDEVLSDESIKKLLNEPLDRLPKEVWKQRTGNMGEYFKGWYTVTRTDYGYLYEGLYPWDD